VAALSSRAAKREENMAPVDLQEVAERIAELATKVDALRRFL
jgi:hypothetical protein